MQNRVLKIAVAVLAVAFLLTAVSPSFAASSGGKIKAVQQALNKAGYGVKVDGKMGPETQSALMKFQKDKGLKVTGRADAQTTAKLGVK